MDFPYFFGPQENLSKPCDEESPAYLTQHLCTTVDRIVGYTESTYSIWFAILRSAIGQLHRDTRLVFLHLLNYESHSPKTASKLFFPIKPPLKSKLEATPEDPVAQYLLSLQAEISEENRSNVKPPSEENFDYAESLISMIRLDDPLGKYGIQPSQEDIDLVKRLLSEMRSALFHEINRPRTNTLKLQQENEDAPSQKYIELPQAYQSADRNAQAALNNLEEYEKLWRRFLEGKYSEKRFLRMEILVERLYLSNLILQEYHDALILLSQLNASKYQEVRSKVATAAKVFILDLLSFLIENKMLGELMTTFWRVQRCILISLATQELTFQDTWKKLLQKFDAVYLLEGGQIYLAQAPKVRQLCCGRQITESGQVKGHPAEHSFFTRLLVSEWKNIYVKDTKGN